MAMKTWSFRRNGKHQTDAASLTSASTLTLEGELLKIKGTTKEKRPPNSLDSIVSLRSTSPILSGLPPAVPPKTPGDPLVFSPVVRENGRQQPFVLPREVTESARMSRVPSGVVMIADIVVDPETTTPSSAATSIRSASEPLGQSSLPLPMPLEDSTRPPLPARRPDTKPSPAAPVSTTAAVRIPVPSTTPDELLEEINSASSSSGSLKSSAVIVGAFPVPHSNVVSLGSAGATRPDNAPIMTAPVIPHRQSTSQPPTPSLTPDSSPSFTSDSSSSSSYAAIDISEDFFASASRTPRTPQQQQQQQQQPPQQQQQHSNQQDQHQHQQNEEVSHTTPHDTQFRLPPSSPPPPPPPAASPSSLTRIPTKRNIPKPFSFITDAASLLRRLFNDPLYSDMDLSVDETTFHIHRGVLAEHCSYFREFFTNARAQEPTTEIRRLDCSYAPITFERGRPFSIAQIDSDDDSMRQAAMPLTQARPNGKDHAGGQDVLGSEGDEDGLCFADVEDSSSTTEHGCDPVGHPRAVYHQQQQPSGSNVDDGGETCSRSDLRSGLKLDSKASLPPTPKSGPSITFATPIEPPIDSFSAVFVAADQRSVGYTSHHFACFLQILYGLLHPLHLHEDDLLAVFRIAHIYGVPGLVNLLGDRIWDTLELTTETWPCLVRFAERFCLEDIKRRALKHASETREMWTAAVETLGLDDFKVFLLGIDQPADRTKTSTTAGSSSSQGHDNDLRGVKDELLMMFLLVHYQDSSSSKESRDDDDNNSINGNSASEPHHYQSHPPPRDSNAAMTRKLSRNRRDSACFKIRQQLQQRPTGPPPPLPTNLPSRINSTSNSNNTKKTATGHPHQQQTSSTDSLSLGIVSLSSTPPSQRRQTSQSQTTTKVEKAKMWMTRFKRDCGWGGQVSLLD
ncbi:hypothetical protein BGX23_011457 [Mortierella sp. AD031]|nr:hypothetical protein BGX23_011457 [Mortierella sp. AD031]